MGFPSTRVRSALLLSFSHAYIYSAESSRTSFDKMSDAEGDAPAPVEPTGPMDVGTALQEVLKTAAIHDGLARGLNEAVRALDKRQAHLCVLAKNCNEGSYVKLIEALCAEHNIALLKVEDNKKLGEWSGLCKLTKKASQEKLLDAAVLLSVTTARRD